MLGWRRRNDGFEWRQYVRTTIALRRQARRDKAEQLREQAAEGMKKAGAKAGAAARQGARQLGAGSRVAAIGAAGSLGRVLGWLARSTGAAARALGRGLAAAARAAVRLFDRFGPKRTWARVTCLGGLLAAVFMAGWSLKPAPGQRGAFASLPGLPSLSLLSLGPTMTPVNGRAVVAGPASIRIGQTTIRLTGVEAPDRDQVCTRPGNRRWRCGDGAVQALTRIAAGRNLACEVRAADAQGVVQGTCLEGKADIAAALVKGGHVFAATGFRASYTREEAEARTAKLGIWAGEAAERPEAWRARVWAEAQKRTPDGCPIKGRVAGSARVYVLPWSADYERVRVDVRRGGRWFCSERDALDAGWKPEVRS